jgi:hypothetical protein
MKLMTTSMMKVTANILSQINKVSKKGHLKLKRKLKKLKETVKMKNIFSQFGHNNNSDMGYGEDFWTPEVVMDYSEEE